MVISFIGGGNGYTRKRLNLPHVTDKLYYFMLYRIHLARKEIQSHHVGGARALIVQVVVNQLPCDHDHDGSRQILHIR